MIPTLIGFEIGVLFPEQPQIDYFGTGQFSILNYNPTLIYESTLLSGSGIATLNTSTGIYTLNNTNARFSVVAKYFSGTPNSAPGFMERKSYTYSCRTVPQTCEQGCNCSVSCNGYCNTGPCPPGVGQGFRECGCPDFYCGTITVTCQVCYYDCSYVVCDVLIDQPGYTNSGTEWYKES
jgi:hypothetical protein